MIEKFAEFKIEHVRRVTTGELTFYQN